jgi:NADPH-dependent glutamate synthase beta subunit-like oxidoreductase
VDGKLTALRTIEVNLANGRLEEVAGSEKEWPCDLAILAMGFVSPEESLATQFGLDTDSRNNIQAEYGDYRTSVEGNNFT